METNYIDSILKDSTQNKFSNSIASNSYQGADTSNSTNYGIPNRLGEDNKFNIATLNKGDIKSGMQSTNGMSGFQMADVALGTVSAIGSIWSAVEQNSLAKKTFNFNKDMMTKNYDMAKSAYDARVRRGKNLSASIYGDKGKEIIPNTPETGIAKLDRE